MATARSLICRRARKSFKLRAVTVARFEQLASSIRLPEQVIVARGVLPTLPLPYELQTGSLSHGNEFFRCGPKRNGGSAVDPCGLAGELPVDHSAQHSEPRPKPVLTVQVGKQFVPRRELGCGIVLFLIGNLAQENAGARLCNAMNFAQADRNLFARNYQQDAVADDDRGAVVGKGDRSVSPCLASRPTRRRTATSSSVASKPIAVLVPTSSAIRNMVPSPHPMSTRSSLELSSTASAIC